MAIEFSGLKAQASRLEGLDKAIRGVLDHGQFIGGPEVAQLEQELATRSGSEFAVSCSSGTDALLMALMAEGIGPGDAVIVPTFTFPATAEVVSLLGAWPVFVDVDEESFNVDPALVAGAVEAARQASLRPRALIAVDLYGRPAAYADLAPIGAACELLLIADAAQSFGGSLNGVRVGHLAPVTVTSFFPAKPLGCYGDGGCLFTDDPARAELFRSLRSHGRGSDKYDIERSGLNARLDTIQAAILLEKLTVFEKELELRREVAARYTELLEGVARCPGPDGGSVSTWAQYTLRVQERARVAEASAALGIPTAVYYPRPLHRQPAYERYLLRGQEFPVAEKLCREVLSLPMHPYLTAEHQSTVAQAVIASL